MINKLNKIIIKNSCWLLGKTKQVNPKRQMKIQETYIDQNNLEKRAKLEVSFPVSSL